MENNDKLKTNIHNAGVGGSSPPITTISHKAFSKFQQTVNPIGITLGLHMHLIKSTIRLLLLEPLWRN